MGNAGFTEVISPKTLSKSEFSYKHAIGRGGFGKVWLVSFNGDSNIYAMKEMLKLQIVSKQCVNSVVNEQKILSLVHHPFIVNMKFAFQDRENLYLVMDLIKGGDLRYHLHNHRTFSEEITKFYAACIITGLEFLHVNNIIHRDLKPENLVLDSKGYLRITDFGISRQLNSDNSRDTSGTPGYMAPEVLLRKNHGIAVDYFALGVIIFEFMTGKRPYQGRSRKEIKEKIMTSQAKLTRSQVPPGWSLESVDFVNKLLANKPEERLGFRGPGEVKSHIWLREIPWKSILEKKIDSPFKPEDGENFDSRSLVNIQDDIDHTIDLSSIQPLFKGYYYDCRDKSKGNESTLKLYINNK